MQCNACYYFYYVSFSFLWRKLQFQLLDPHVNFGMTAGWATFVLDLLAAVDNDDGPHFSLI